jgi:WD40 repeat protein
MSVQKLGFITLLLFFIILNVIRADGVELEVITLENVNQVQELARFGNGTFTDSLAYSPDGQTLAVTGSIGVWFYQADNLEVIPSLLDLNERVNQVGFNTDGSYFLYQVRNSVYVTDAVSKEVLLHIPKATHFAIHPDNEFLAVGILVNAESFYGRESDIQLWHIPTQAQTQTIRAVPAEYGKVRGTLAEMEFSPDGNTLGVAITGIPFDNCGEMQTSNILWDFNGTILDTATLISEANYMHTNYLVFHPTKPLVFTAQDHSVKQWDMENQEESILKVDVLRDWYYSPVFDLAVSPDGKIIGSIFNGHIWLWNAETSEFIVAIEGGLSINALAFHGEQIVALANNALWVWNDINASPSLIPLRDSLVSAQFNQNLTGFVSQDEEHQLRLWSIDGKSTEKFHNAEGSFYSSGGDHIIYQADAGFYVWNLAAQEEVSVIDKMTQAVWNQDGSLLAVRKDDYHVEVWDMQEINVQNTFVMETAIQEMWFSPLSTYLVFKDDTGGIFIQNLNGDVHRIDTYTSVIQITFTPDEQHFYVTYLTEVPFDTVMTDKWQVLPLKTLSTVEGGYIGFPNNGELIHTHSYNGQGSYSATIRFYDGQTLSELNSIRYGGHVENAAMQVFFSLDSMYLITFTTSLARCTGDFNTMTIWDAVTAESVNSSVTTEDHNIAFASEGSFFALSENHTVNFWNPQTGEQVLTIADHTDTITFARFNATNTMLITNSDDGTVRLWGIIQD